jgi:acylphosphatase
LTICRQYRISGRVQGVFFRASTQSAASDLGLTGWVRNTASGEVELVACGDDAQLMQLERWLWQGPRHAQVEQVVVAPAEAQTVSGFEIRY